MQVNSVNNAQSFTGFKITNKTKQGVTQLIEDFSKRFVNKEGRPNEYMKWQKEFVEDLQKEIIEPLKGVKAEVEYNEGKIFVRNADGSKTVELDRGKVAPLHPQEYTIVQYPTKGHGENCCVKVDYGTRDAARKAAEHVHLNSLSDLIQAREIAKHFDALDAKKVAANEAVAAYQRHLDGLADNVLGLL